MDAEFLKACETGNLNEVLNILYYHDDGEVKLLDTNPATLDHMHYFHAVCLKGYCNIIEQLIPFNVNVNLDSSYGTPLAVACQGGHLETVELLIKKNAKIYDPNTDPTLTPFFQACKHGHLDILTYIIEREPDAILELGPQLLVEACREGFLDIVLLLVSKNIDINGEVHPSSPSSASLPFHSSLETPLQAACSQHQVEVVQYLLQEEVDVSVGVVQQYYQVLGEAVVRNFKEHVGKYRKQIEAKRSLLEGDFSIANFYDVHKSWFTAYAEQLVLLDLSNNHLSTVPKEILNLPMLREINLSANNLFELPEVENVEDSRLEEISAANNKLVHVPLSIFNIKRLRHLNFVNNQIISLLNDDVTEQFDVDDIPNDDVTWQCHSLKSLNLAGNRISFIPSAIHSAHSLEKLQLSGNQLTSFPKGWKCPLRILNLSQNQLSLREDQQSLFNTWTQTLIDLNLSSNKLTSISWDICQIQSLQYLDLSHNAIESMPAKTWWKCSNLRKLNLAYNKLYGIYHRVETLSPSRLSRRFTITRSPTEERTEIEDEFPYEVFGATLESLDISYNQLVAVPTSVCQLTSLEDLNLSGNIRLKTLPPELGNLIECYQLGLNDLHLSGIPKYARSGQHTSKDVLTYLRAKQRKAVAYYRMKLMVIGLQGRGKTTLLAALRNKPLPLNISTVGIVVNEWTVSGTQSLFEKVTLIGKKEQSNPSITFSTWDLAGQEIYYSTHQCFLSSNTLYLAVWNVSHGDEGIDKLKPWLLNVQARAPGSHVIIVGTHLDLLPDAGKVKRINELRLTIAKRYNKKGFPLIKGYFMVSCTTAENMPELRQAVYQAALELKESENAGKGDSLIGRKIPLSYLKLQENVVKEAVSRKKENKPPILNEEQMLELAKQDSNNDILERDELILAARFLHENGVILHYNDRSRGLDKLYFIEPGWLCEIMALLVTVKETNAFVKGGIIERSNVDLMLRNPRLPPQFMDQYVQLMERFEVALTLDEHRLLVPSMLPRDKPGLHLPDLSKIISGGNSAGMHTVSEDGDEHSKETKTKSPPQYLRRLYKMNYVPSGFWSRLIARLMIAVQRWGTEEGLGDELICNEQGKAVRTTSNFRPVPHGYSMIYWREGMGVVYEGGHLLVESYVEKERNAYLGMREDIEGVMVTVFSAEKDFSVLGFVTDQVNSLISEWYPGLEESDKHGIPLVRHVIPCPICAVEDVPPLRLRRSLSMKNVNEMEEGKPTEFSLMECAAAAVDYTEIACPQHVDTPVKLCTLVPDLVLSDLPPDLVIDNKMFVFKPTEENRLGSGGAGEVFLGMYKKQKVAVKRFYSSNHGTTRTPNSGLGPSFGCLRNRGGSRHTDGGSFAGRSHVFTVSPTTIEEDLRRTKILSSFWELRQEVSVLGRLDHPCVVALVGVSIQPLCIVLELSPLGSLYSILEKESMKLESEKFRQNAQSTNDVRKPIFDRYLTYKIVYQVAHALHYLHNLGIIYRDLKSDNLLVWSMEKDALVHVKLSDYGISKFATPQGMLGEEGTPGFQAPEVRTGSTYNEKVDIFSFAMLIYEILSGLRPFHECRCSAQIKKALRRGERPSLDRSYVDSELPELEALMTRCWRESAGSRPSAEAVLDLMEDPSFLCLNRTMPYVDHDLWHSITAFIPVSSEDQVLDEAEQSKGSHSVLLWGGVDDERFYSVIDCKTGIDQVAQTLCVGPRVACLARVGDKYWLGTEGSVIEVFGRAKPGSDLKVLWSVQLNGQVLGLEVEHFVDRRSVNSSTDRVRRIFACLANGSVVVISRSDLRQASSVTCNFHFKSDANEKIRQEASVFSVVTKITIGEPGTSACCLLFVKDGKELWVGCGNKVGIINIDTLEVEQVFRAYVSSRSNIRAMVSNGPTVFTINRKTPDVFQWCVETRQCICKFYIEQEDPRGLNVAREISSKNEDDVIDDVTNNVIAKTSGVILESESKIDAAVEGEKGKQVASANDPQLYIDINQKPVAPCQRQPSLMRSFKCDGSRNSRKKRIVPENSVPEANKSANGVQKMRSRTQVMCYTERRVTCALIVDGNLWVGRETGDIVVIDISGKQGTEEYGKVHAVLTMGIEHGHSNKGVHSILRVGGDKVVSCSRVYRELSHTDSERSHTAPTKQRSFITPTSPLRGFWRTHPVAIATAPREEQSYSLGKNEKYQVCIWERWKSEDFQQFYKYHEDLEKAS